MKNKLSETFKSMESVSFGLNRKRLSDGKFLFFYTFFCLENYLKMLFYHEFVFESCVTHSPGV